MSKGVIDTHQYTAWNGPYSSFDNLLTSSYNWQSPATKYKYIIGEWSLAIDNCEMWLNGFMDNLPDYPLFECSFQPCFQYEKYSIELSQSKYGPFGSGISYPEKNKKEDYYFDCPLSIPLKTHFYTTIMSEKELARQLFIAKSSAFEKFTVGWIYWNFRTESNSYQWDYLAYIQLIEKEKENEVEILKINTNTNTHNIFLKIGVICVFIIFVFSVLGTHIYFLNKIRKDYIPLNTKDFENQNYQSILI